MMNAVLNMVAGQGVRRAAAALVLAAAPLLYALPASAMSYGMAFHAWTGNHYADAILAAGMQLSCYFIPLAPPVCIPLMLL